MIGSLMYYGIQIKAPRQASPTQLRVSENAVVPCGPWQQDNVGARLCVHMQTMTDLT
jgi:hypothetical protein